MGDEGVQFPLVDGRRSTQRTSQDVFAAAAGACDAELAAEIGRAPSWRSTYPRHLWAVTAGGARSPAAGVAVARAGLDRVHSSFTVVSGDAELPLAAAMASPAEPALTTRTITGAGQRTGLVVPYRGRDLHGDALLAAASDWERRGVVEPAVVTALRRLTEQPAWLDLDGTWFAVLGAGAEMAPTERLLQWGADVVAVDVPRHDIWSRLESQAAAGTGRLHVPVDDRAPYTGDAPHSAGGPLGVDLTTGAPRVLAWLTGFDRPLVIGNYAYADGATFARVSVAADAVIAGLRARRDDHGVVCLATPTDTFAVSAEVVAAARRRGGGVTGAAARGVARRTVRTDDGHEVGIADSLVLQQGPNYALAKRIQRWRAVVTHADGAPGIVHVAPPTHTRSVLKNRVLAAAYAGAALFGVETFAPETSRALMAALLVHDLRTDRERARRPAAEHELTAPAVHGGLWRLPWDTRSALPLAVLRGAPALLRSAA